MKHIVFEKPDFERLRSEGVQGVDMHFHTKYSDTFTRLSSIIKKAKKQGIGVSITDHNRIKGAVLADRMQKDVMIVPGIEVNCYEGTHMLFYFYSMNDLTDFYIKHIKDYLESNPYMATKIKTEPLIDAANDYNCVISAAHPYIPVTGGIIGSIDKNLLDTKIWKKIHSVEVINAALPEKLNLKAVHLAHELNMPVTGGSDGHSLQALGSAVTVAEANSVESFLESIRKKQNTVVGGSQAFLPRLTSYPQFITKHMQYLIPSFGLKYRRAKDLSIKRNIRPFLQDAAHKIRDNPLGRVKEKTKKISKMVKDKVRR